MQYALNTTVDSFDSQLFLRDMASRCETSDMAAMIAAVGQRLQSHKDDKDMDEQSIVAEIVGSARRPGSGMGFQIASVHMAPCVLWAACRHFRLPARAVQAAIDLGGDTDTTACMVGAIVGALHGES